MTVIYQKYIGRHLRCPARKRERPKKVARAHARAREFTRASVLAVTKKRCQKSCTCACARAISSENRCKRETRKGDEKAACAHARARFKHGAPQTRSREKVPKRPRVRTCVRDLARRCKAKRALNRGKLVGAAFFRTAVVNFRRAVPRHRAPHKNEP